MYIRLVQSGLARAPAHKWTGDIGECVCVRYRRFVFLRAYVIYHSNSLANWGVIRCHDEWWRCPLASSLSLSSLNWPRIFPFRLFKLNCFIICAFRRHFAPHFSQIWWHKAVCGAEFARRYFDSRRANIHTFTPRFTPTSDSEAECVLHVINVYVCERVYCSTS